MQQRSFEKIGRKVTRHDFGHDHRCVRPHIIQTDNRSILELQCGTPSPFMIGLNCALGAERTAALCRRAVACKPISRVSAHPNAGAAERVR